MEIMKRSKLIAAIDEDLTVKHKKTSYIKKEEYYFIHIYKFIRAYEKILRNLWFKEKHLIKKQIL